MSADSPATSKSNVSTACSSGAANMSDDDVSFGKETAFSWKVYSVSAHDKAPLIKFIREALEARGCTIQHMSAANRAPFHIVLDLPGGERLGVPALAFLA